MDVAPFAGEGLQHHVGDEAEGEAVGDRVGERHDDRRDRRRRRFGKLVPVDLGQFAHHQSGDIEQRGRGGVGRHRAGQRRDEQRRQEQDGDHQRGEARAPARLHTRRAFDIGGGARRAEQRAGDDRRRIGEQGAPEPIWLALLDQLRPLGDADQRAGGVEHLDQHEDQDDVDEPAVQRADDVELQEGRRHGRRHRDKAVEGADAGDPGQHSHGEDADEDRPAHAQGVEHRNDEEAENGEQRSGLLEIAEADQRGRIVDDDAGILQRDDTEEQTDTGGDGATQRMRDAGDQPASDAGDGEDHEDDARDEDRAQRLLPGKAERRHHREGEEGVEPHARRHADGPVGDQRHHRRAERGRDAGGHEDRVAVHAGGGQDLGVDEDDVGHRQKCRQARDQFGAHAGTVLGEPEEAFKHDFPPVRERSGVLLRPPGGSLPRPPPPVGRAVSRSQPLRVGGFAIARHADGGETASNVLRQWAEFRTPTFGVTALVSRSRCGYRFAAVPHP